MSTCVWEGCTLTVRQNADFALSLGYATVPSGLQAQIANAAPFNFAGATAYLQVRVNEDAASEQLLNLSSPSNGLALGSSVVDGISVGTISIAIPHGTTADLPDGSWYFDLLVVQSGGQDFYASGDFIVQPGQGGSS